MRVAILSVSKNGELLSKKLKSLLDNDFTVIKTDTFHKDVENNIKRVFNDYDVIIGIMATGILVRNICKNISNKYSDPAVLSIDDKGNFVISLLSGHMGGANQFTKKIANLLSSKEVITTATDIHGKIGVDVLANKFYWNIINKKEVLTFNKALLENEILHLKSNSDTMRYIEEFFMEVFFSDNKELEHGTLEDVRNYIKNKYNIVLKVDEKLNNKIIAKIRDTELEFKPKKLVVGIGSRKNVREEHVLIAIEKVMADLDVSVLRIDGLATVSIKRKELGIIKAFKIINEPFSIIEKEKIEDFYLSDRSKDCRKSSFVKEKFGIDGVSEACAMIAAGENSKLIHRKIAICGVTVAVAVSK
ncbi:MAG: cobalamin biosynthesis protein [Methanobacteriaceae archaeon]|jgi:cobalt-precorrin 5A hydrolase|nr:cobalamin biosynthesis protein [Candidatus Methanorudis spinitermitis]